MWNTRSDIRSVSVEGKERMKSDHQKSEKSRVTGGDEACDR